MTDFSSIIVPGLASTWLRTMWFVPVYLAGAMMVPLCLWVFLKLVFPRVATVAGITIKSVTQQPIFAILAIFGILAILIFPFIPYNTLGEDIKIMKTAGLTLIRVLGILLAVWSAGASVSDEIEEKTALTLLSKPISRRQLVMGKFFGIIIGVAIFCIILSTFFVPTCAYKVVFDSRENCELEPLSEACLESMKTVVPALVLTFMQVVIMTSIAVALSTRLPVIPNMTICVLIYALGHLVPLMAMSSALGQFAIVGFLANFLSAIVPGLAHFSIEAAIGGGELITSYFLLLAGIYCSLYTTVALLVALILFEDRDLA